MTGNYSSPPLPAPRYFPSPESATADGVVCMGGSLNTELLLDAYAHGIFPWPPIEEEPLLWCSLDPRSIIELNDFRPARRLLRRWRSGQFTATINQRFPEVIRGCSVGLGREEGTWITPDLVRAYTRLHQLGYAHSLEVYQEGDLVGGVYGVALGGMFAAESMFHRVSYASTMALTLLVAHLRRRGYTLLDIQQKTEHTGRLGAIDLPRREFLLRLAQVVDLPITFGTTLAGSPEELRR